MKTTLALEADLVLKLKALADSKNVSFEEVVNNVIRRGLSLPAESVSEAVLAYTIVPHQSTLRAGIDPLKLNQISM